MTDYICYFAVTPDPTDDETFLKVSGKYCFFVKFGDGDFRTAYYTTNPTVRGWENRESTESRLETYDSFGKKITPKLGKYFEYTYIKTRYASSDGESTEWHRIDAKGAASVETLRTILKKLGGLFSDFDYKKSKAVKDFETEFAKITEDSDTYTIT